MLEGRPEAHRVEGEIHSKAPYFVTAVGRRARAGGRVCGGSRSAAAGRRCGCAPIGPLEPADADEPGGLGRSPGEDDLRGRRAPLLSTDDAEVVLDLGERRVVVALDGHPNPVEVGASARARGP